jgi:hypothetical protein
MKNRPTLLNSCAYAATAAEAKFRINGKPQAARSVSVVALDRGAARVMADLIDRPWLGARFLTVNGAMDGGAVDGGPPASPARDGHQAADLMLRREHGDQVGLSEALRDTDLLLMIATADDGAAAAGVIGDACTLRGITTAAVVLGSSSQQAVRAMRPYARVLLVTEDQQDVAELMSAVGA